MQAISIVALLLAASRTPAETARITVQAAGLAWLVACAAIGWQTFHGRAVLSASPATTLAFGILLLWGALCVRAAFSARPEARGFV